MTPDGMSAMIFWNEVRIEFWLLVAFEKLFQLILESLHPTISGSPDDADFVLVELLKIELRIGNGLIGSGYGVLCEEIKLAGIVSFEIVARIETLEFAGKLGFEMGGIEPCNETNSILSGDAVGPEFGYRIAQWCEGTHSGDHHSV
jgi:hypothetical protein